MFLHLPILLLLVRSATLGKLFNTTKYGSKTFAKNFDHHNAIAIIVPSIVPNKNPTTVSYTVTPICFSKSFEPRFINVSNTLLGLLVIKLSITFKFASISHIPKNATNIAVCVRCV